MEEDGDQEADIQLEVKELMKPRFYDGPSNAASQSICVKCSKNIPLDRELRPFRECRCRAFCSDECFNKHGTHTSRNCAMMHKLLDKVDEKYLQLVSDNSFGIGICPLSS